MACVTKVSACQTFPGRMDTVNPFLFHLSYQPASHANNYNLERQNLLVP